MSSLVFPMTLPGLDIAVKREPYYETKTLESVSGRETRIRWRRLARVRYTVTFNFARTYTQAPSPNSSYSETGVILAFLDAHHGSFDSFLFDDVYTGERVRVRLLADSIRMTRIVSGVWAIESIDLVTVI